MQFLVYGAGAVGSVLGGMLSLNRHHVCLIGRNPHVEAVTADGLRIKSTTAEYLAHPSACAALGADCAGSTECVVLGVKSQDIPSAVDALAATIGSDVPVVCIQNGVAAEPAASVRFQHVYGAVIRMTCSMVQPGNVSFQEGGRVVVGKYPRGSDAFARSFAGIITMAGVDAVVTRDLMADRWLKVVVNVQSVFHAVIDSRDHDTNEFHALKAAIIEETRDVLKKAKIRARSCDGRDLSINDMIDELHRPRATRTGHGVKVRNSVWQDLYLKRRSMETEHIHGPVIALGEQYGVATPYNRAALELALRCHRDGLGPESLRLSEVLATVERGSAH
jgi:2-dehydropantoate 2-reductase